MSAREITSHRLGPVQAIPLGEGRAFAVGDTQVAVFRLRDGLRATQAVCPHAGGPLADGQIDFTIDQQPYLQGFLPVLELYLIKASGTLTGPADVNTGLKFLDKETVVPYNSTKSRYEGTGSSAGVTKG